MRLPLRNIGWGPMHDTLLRFALIDSQEYKGEISEYPYVLNAKTIETRFEANNLASYFEKAGVDISLLAELQGSTGSDGNWIYFSNESSLGQPHKGDDFLGKVRRRMPRSEYLQLLKEAYGPFGSGEAVVVGEMQYGSIEKSGEMRTRVNKFVAKVNIGKPGKGAPKPPSHKYNVKLRVSGSDYEVRIPISHVIEPGKADRFLLQIAADKSSFHEFDVSFHFNNYGEITSNPIALDLFLSRDDTKLMERHRQDEVIRLTRNN